MAGWIRSTLPLTTSARLLLCVLAVMASQAAFAQQEDLTPEERALVDRPISEVRVEGLSRVPLQKVLNTLRTQAGDPYDPRTIKLDLENLYRLGDFRAIDVEPVLQQEGSVEVVFVVVEQPLLLDVQVVGNTKIADQKILQAVLLRPNVPRDEYLVQESIQRIRDLYRDKGHFRVEVGVEETTVGEDSILIFRIIEGPRVRVRAIEFRGNQSFTRDQLKSQIKSETYFFILRKGRLDEQAIARDILALDTFYKDRGYLDVRVGRLIELSPDDHEAKIVFVIEEGEVFTMRSVTSNGSTLFSDEQLAALLSIKSGDIYSKSKIDRSKDIVRDAYGGLGYLDIRVDAEEIRVPAQQQVDLLLNVNEGPNAGGANRYTAGDVRTTGNFITRDRVIRRHLPFSPGRQISSLDIREAEQRLRDTRLFGDVRVTVQEPEDETSPYRDVLVEVEETNTGSFDFGIAFGSDSGAFFNFAINRRNFDIADWPESLEEFLKQRAFRGGGQRFSLRLEPGLQVSRYSVGFAEPWFLDRPLELSTNAMYRNWDFFDFSEERVSTDVSLARRLGRLWTISLRTSYKRVELSEIADDAPTEIFDDAGPTSLVSVGANVRRATVDRRIRPGRGSVVEFGIDQVADIDGGGMFTRLDGEYTVFITLREDFLGRRSVLRLNTRAGYIFGGDAPTYEQYYLGGRSFRGFDFRTISPKGIRADTGEPSDESVGGEWLFFLGAQYEVPFYEETIAGVVFFDSGTVSDEIGFDDYRVSVGVGLRLYIEFFGPAPLAFDLGIPLLAEEDDEEEVFSFSIEIPF